MLRTAALALSIAAASMTANLAHAGATDTKSTKPAKPIAKAISAGWLTGIIRDAEGMPVAGAKVRIELPPKPIAAPASKGAAKSARPTPIVTPPSEYVEVTTDHRGRFHVGNLPDSQATQWTYPIEVTHQRLGNLTWAAAVRGGDDTLIELSYWTSLMELSGDSDESIGTDIIGTSGR
jgi:hypothetical protein